MTAHGQHARGVRKRLGVPRKRAGAIEEREKLVLKITRTIHKLETERKRLKQREKALRKELLGQRRGLRLALQADTEIDANDSEDAS